MEAPKVLIPLDIADVMVLKVELGVTGAIHITVESTLDYGYCRKCGQKITTLHGYDEEVVVQHLPSFGRTVFLHYRPKRYECRGCEGQPTTTQQVVWHEPKSPHTKAYDAHLLRALVNSPVADVSAKEGLSYDTVWGVLERCIASEVDWSQYTVLGTLGIDEIARRKGHGDFIAIVTAHLPDGHIAILGVLPDRDKATVKAFLQAIPARLRATLTSVCCDLYEGYVQAVHEVLPRVRLVVDRFHVAKLYREAADEVRKTEMTRLKATLPRAEYKTLKGHLWAFRKAQADLTPQESALLNKLFGLSPRLKQAYTLREQLTAIFNRASSRQRAEQQLRRWRTRVQRSGLTCFDTFLKTLARYWDNILNYFIARENSGFVEGFNTTLKVLLRRCYGLFNLKHLFQRIFLDVEGYRLLA